MLKRSYQTFIFLLLSIQFAIGQTVGLELPKGVDQIKIPFKYENNFIIVDITLNKILKLKFIFDTGAEYTVLNKREVADVLGLGFEKEFKILGSDMTTELTAYLSRGVSLDFNKNYGSQQDILILAEDYFRIEEFAGINVHGILGANFFKRYVVKIDYHKQILTFTRPEIFHEPPKGFKEIPATFLNHKPYLQVSTQIENDSLLQLSMLIDSGASLALIIHNNSHPKLRLPENTIEGNLAMGLGGFITGFMGRVHLLELSDELFFQNILTHFQQLTFAQDTTMMNGRNGILGNLLLKRFEVLIDYPRERVYLKPKKRYNRNFKFDKSGLNILATGPFLNEFTIHQVVKGSPANVAGLKAGDKILRVNGLSKKYYNLKSLTNKLHGRTNKKIRFVIERDGKLQKIRFKLKDYI